MIRPDPIFDKKELLLVDKISKKYQKFTTPGPFSKSLANVGDFSKKNIGKMIPEEVKQIAGDIFTQATEMDFIKEALKQASQGGTIIARTIAKFTIDKKGLIKHYNNKGFEITSISDIGFLRSYIAERVAKKDNFGNISASLIEGGTTGFVGLIGVPIDLVLSYLLYFRAVQSVAMAYGYDVQDDPAEMEIASQVLLLCMAPTADQGANTIGGMLGKMMLFAEGAALQNGLNKTFAEMIKEGGAQLFFVQLRALANKAAQKALENAGERGLEAGALQGVLKQVGKLLSKDVAKKSIPYISSIIGGFINVYTMDRVLEGANLIYHKRFLFEKEVRCNPTE